MKAVIYTEYGGPDVLHLQETDKPIPADNEILVRVKATSVNYGDLLARNFKAVSPRQFNMPLLFWFPTRFYFGVNKPKIQVLGAEFAGEVEAVGQQVQRFKQGDSVFGYLGQKMGAYAEYVCLSEKDCVAIKPINMTFAEAAVVPYGAIMALSLLRKANLQPGQKVLINGASGGIGSAAVQIAKHHFGANVTGVCGTPRLAFVKSLGADQVIDYTQEDFTDNGQTYDLIFDVLGKSSISRCKQSLTPTGIHLFASFKMKQLVQMVWTSLRGNKRVICAIAPGSVDDLLAVKELIEAGKIQAIIDRSYPLSEASEAHRYVESGQKQASVVITMA